MVAELAVLSLDPHNVERVTSSDTPRGEREELPTGPVHEIVLHRPLDGDTAPARIEAGEFHGMALTLTRREAQR